MEKARDNSSMGFGKVKRKKEVILDARRDKIRVHFASLMDTCHLKNTELEPKLQSFKAESCLEETL